MQCKLVDNFQFTFSKSPFCRLDYPTAPMCNARATCAIIDRCRSALDHHHHPFGIPPNNNTYQSATNRMHKAAPPVAIGAGREEGFKTSWGIKLDDSQMNSKQWHRSLFLHPGPPSPRSDFPSFRFGWPRRMVGHSQVVVLGRGCDKFAIYCNRCWPARRLDWTYINCISSCWLDHCQKLAGTVSSTVKGCVSERSR